MGWIGAREVDTLVGEDEELLPELLEVVHTSQSGAQSAAHDALATRVSDW